MRYKSRIHFLTINSLNKLANFHFRFRNFSRFFHHVNKEGRKTNYNDFHVISCHHEFIRENSVDKQTTINTGISLFLLLLYVLLPVPQSIVWIFWHANSLNFASASGGWSLSSLSLNIDILEINKLVHTKLSIQ